VGGPITASTGGDAGGGAELGELKNGFGGDMSAMAVTVPALDTTATERTVDDMDFHREPLVVISR
jgi:hypothetical protein